MRLAQVRAEVRVSRNRGTQDPSPAKLPPDKRARATGLAKLWLLVIVSSSEGHNISYAMGNGFPVSSLFLRLGFKLIGNRRKNRAHLGHFKK